MLIDMLGIFWFFSKDGTLISTLHGNQLCLDNTNFRNAVDLKIFTILERYAIYKYENS